MKKLKNSTRGLTFSVEENEAQIGGKYRYVIKKETNEIIIIPDEKGTNTISRKKAGKKFKPLFDIRSKEVKELCSKANYLEVVVENERIVVKTYAICRSKFQIVRNNIVSICDVLGRQTGEIVLNKAVGNSYAQPFYSLYNDDYFAYVQSTIPSWMRNTKKKELQKVYQVASLFSGAGLLDYSFRDKRVKFVYGVDFDEDACRTYEENIGKHIVCKDIRNVNANEIPNTDIVIGGPCCQGYSNANRISIEEESARTKRLLIDDYIRLVQAKRPDVFVIENVPQLLTKEDGLYINKVFDGLSDYQITTTIINDDEVGGYTIRKRAIVIGSLIGEIILPEVHLATKQTVRNALSKVTTEWFNYEDVTMPRETTRNTMSYVPQGGNWQDVPESVHKFGPSTQSNTYRRLAMDEPSPTIANWRKCILIHPTENRILTVSEVAALMGLDKNFKVLGKTLNAKQQQVCNGVTQAVGRFVKNSVLRKLDEYYGVNKNIVFN